jgi:hypothetical protein
VPGRKPYLIWLYGTHQPLRGIWNRHWPFTSGSGGPSLRKDAEENQRPRYSSVLCGRRNVSAGRWHSAQRAPMKSMAWQPDSRGVFVTEEANKWRSRKMHE